MRGKTLFSMTLADVWKNAWLIIMAAGVVLLSECMASALSGLSTFEWLTSHVRDGVSGWGVGVGAVARLVLLMVQITGPIVFACMMFWIGLIVGVVGKRVAFYASVMYPGVVLLYEVWVSGHVLGLDAYMEWTLVIQKLAVMVCGAFVGYASWYLGGRVRKGIRRAPMGGGLLQEPRKDVSGGGVGLDEQVVEKVAQKCEHS